MPSYETLLLERKDALAYVTINRPKSANTISRQLWTDFNSVLDELEDDVETRVVLVTAVGDRHFCGGADLKENADALGDRNPKAMGRDFITHLEEIPQPVIAVINGACMGGGCEIALGCDFRFMAEEAKIGPPEILFGALPAGGGTQRLPRAVGIPKAKELIYTGRHVSAQEALDIGLVTGIAPRERLMGVAEEFARELAEKAGFALRTAKMLTTRALDMSLADGLAFERRTIMTMASREEAKAAQERAMAKSGTYKNIFSKS